MLISILGRLSMVLVIALTLGSVNAQVTIAPTNMFLSEESPFGTYMVINGSNTTQEITIDFTFSYSASDENGDRTIIIDDTTSAESYSIANRVRAFPRNFTLAPDQRQVVRLRLSGYQDLEDGTYWARINTQSNPETPPIEVQSNETVTAQVGIRFQQVTGLFFKKGNVSTGIEIEAIRTEVNPANPDELIVYTDYKRTGNSPFLGTITLSLIDTNNIDRASNFVSTSLYFDGTHRQVLDISDLPNGRYTVNVQFESRRTDVPPEDLVQMSPISESTTFSKN